MRVGILLLVSFAGARRLEQEAMDSADGAWQDIPQHGVVPEERYGMTLAAVEGGLWLYGGWNKENVMLHDVWMLNTSSLRWSKLFGSRHPLPRSGPTVWSVNSGAEIYMFGGRTETYRNDLWVYNVALQEWTEILSMSGVPRQRSGASAFLVAPDVLGIHGGRGFRGILNELWTFNITSKVWTLYDTTGPARTQHVVAFYNGTLQVLGGQGDTMVSFFNWTHKTWRHTPHHHTPRESGCYSVAGSNIYEAGGTINGELQADVLQHHTDGTTTVLSSELDAVAGASCSASDDIKTLIIFGGRIATGLHNKLTEITLSNRTVRHSPHRDLPASRALHAAVRISTDMVVFGGINSGYVLGDLWALRVMGEDKITDMLWVQIEPSGTLQPEPRFGHAAAAVGDVMLMFGGELRNGLPCAELWLLQWQSKIWTQIEATQRNWPNPRSGHVMTSDKKGILIYGGESSVGALSDVWRFNLGTSEWTRLVGNTPGVRSHGAIASTGGMYFFFSGGMDNTGTPSKEIWKAEYTETTITWLHITSLHIELGNHAMVIAGPLVNCSFPKLIIVGGQSYGELHESGSKMVTVAPDASCNAGYVSVSGEQWFSARMGHSLLYFGNKLIVYAGYGTTPLREWHHEHTLSDSAVHTLSQLCTFVSTDCWQCAPGYYHYNGTCSMCQHGQYSDHWGASNCSICPVGTFQPAKTAISNRQCTLCPAGTFSPKPGRGACEMCHPYHTCRHGATMPDVVIHDTASALEKESKQPIQGENHLHQVDLEVLNNARTLAWLICLGIVTILLAIFIVMHFSNKLHAMRKFDVLFNGQSAVKIFQYAGTIRIVNRTPLGGLFSLIFVTVLMAFLLTVTVLPYLYNNGIEVRLLPRFLAAYELSLAEETTALSMRLSCNISGNAVTLGTCAVGAQCSPELNISVEDVAGEWQTSCKEYVDTCEVTTECPECTLSTDAAEGRVKLYIEHEDVYSTEIRWQAETKSGLNNNYDSTQTGTIIPAAENVFKGLKTPSEIFILVYPLIETSSWESYITAIGHLFGSSGSAAGSEARVDSLHTTEGFRLEFVLRANTGVQYNRFYYHEPSYYVALALACVAGLLSGMQVLYRIITALTEPKHPHETTIIEPNEVGRTKLLLWEYEWLKRKGTAEELQEFEERLRESGAPIDDKLKREKGTVFYQTQRWRKVYIALMEERQKLFLKEAGLDDRRLVLQKEEVDIDMMKVHPKHMLRDAFTGGPCEESEASVLINFDMAPEPQITTLDKVLVFKNGLEYQKDCAEVNLAADETLCGKEGVILNADSEGRQLILDVGGVITSVPLASVRMMSSMIDLSRAKIDNVEADAVRTSSSTKTIDATTATDIMETDTASTTTISTTGAFNAASQYDNSSRTTTPTEIIDFEVAITMPSKAAAKRQKYTGTTKVRKGKTNLKKRIRVVKNDKPKYHWGAKKLTPWEKVSAKKFREKLPSAVVENPHKIPKSMRSIMEWQRREKVKEEAAKEAAEQQAAEEAEKTKAVEEVPTKKKVVRRKKRALEEAEMAEEAEEMAKAEPAEAQGSNLRGSYQTLQRRKRVKAQARAVDSDEDDEIGDEDEGKNVTGIRSFSQLSKNEPVFGEQAQAPPTLKLPNDKRSLMPDHIKKRKMRELLERVAAGGPVELPKPSIKEAGSRSELSSFEQMQLAAREQYKKFKTSQKKKEMQVTQEQNLSKAAKRKARASDHTQEVNDYV